MLGPHLDLDHSVKDEGLQVVQTATHDINPELDVTGTTVGLVLVGEARDFPTLLIEGLHTRQQQTAFVSAFEDHKTLINSKIQTYAKLRSDLFYFLKPNERLPRTIKSEWQPCVKGSPSALSRAENPLLCACGGTDIINRKKAETDFGPQMDSLYQKLASTVTR